MVEFAPLGELEVARAFQPSPPSTVLKIEAVSMQQRAPDAAVETSGSCLKPIHLRKSRMGGESLIHMITCILHEVRCHIY